MKMTVMKMLGFNNNKTILSLGLLLILQLAPSALGALTKLRSSHVVKQEEAAEPVKVLLLTEALWYAISVLFSGGSHCFILETPPYLTPYYQLLVSFS
jgi:hypothetical protein